MGVGNIKDENYKGNILPIYVERFTEERFAAGSTLAFARS